jgi:hypothetical protein
VKKTKVIREQLGSLAPVLERRLEEHLPPDARRDASLAKAIEESRSISGRAAREELESTRIRDQELA